MSTRKTFCKTAEILKTLKPDMTATTAHDPDEQDAMMSLWRDAVTAFANQYTRENPRFNRSRFETACGVEN